MKWSNEYKIHYYYTDYNNILKPGYIGRYMQETAWYALKNWGPTPQFLAENNLAFILSKISFRYYSEIHEDDIIKAETWANPPKTVIFPRNYRIYNQSKNGEIAAEAVSAWALMDMKEKTILKPDMIEENFRNGFDGEELDFAVQRRFKSPENSVNSSTVEYKVAYSDIDTNLHMNNAAYIDLICDNLYYDGEKLSPDLKKRILSLDLNYNSQAVFGDIIEIYRTVALNGQTEEHYINAKIKSSGQNCFESKVVIKK
ncbi:MAG: thioesterase [Oscillospiraceae bacterium]|nr:thioesterase [Oscillospiraceae bacterium]